VQHAVGFMYADDGDRWLDEDAPPVPPPHGHSIMEAERQAARFTEAGRTGIMRTSSIFERYDIVDERDMERATENYSRWLTEQEQQPRRQASLSAVRAKRQAV